MATPLSSPAPVLTDLRASHTSLPRPSEPTRAVIMTIAMAIMMVWLMPIMMEGLARGSWTWNNVCSPAEPWDRAVSIVA